MRQMGHLMYYLRSESGKEIATINSAVGLHVGDKIMFSGNIVEVVARHGIWLTVKKLDDVIIQVETVKF